jgi:hypothetical protein
MSVQIDSLEFNNLVSQPFGYGGEGPQKGRTYKQWAIAGLLTPAEWATLIGIYDTWRDLRITDPDPETVDEFGDPIPISGQLGTTVAFSFQGPGGTSWTDVDCWFLEAPAGEQAGHFISTSFVVADAAQVREVDLETQEEEATNEDLPDLGTFVLNGAVLTLLSVPDTYDSLPELQMTATGKHYVTGSTSVVRIKQIEGTTTQAGWELVREWYEDTVILTPVVGQYFPVSVPSASAEYRVVNGEKIVQYTVTLTLAEIV